MENKIQKPEGFATKKKIYLISCSNEKINKEAKAMDLYDSPLFKKSIGYARDKAKDKDIKILSAKHGLLSLNTVIKPYDVALGDKDAKQRKEWANNVYEILNRRYDLDNTRFIFLAGDDYSHYLKEMLPHCSDPLEGKKLGERLEYLKKRGFADNGKYFEDLSEEKQDQLLNALDGVGLTAEELEEDGWVEMSEDAFNNHLYFAIVSDPDAGSLQDTALYKVLYQYTGPRDSKNRDFCRRMLSKNLLFRLEDINNLSLSGENQEFGTYDIFTYKGSYNCRHSWRQKFYSKRKDADDQKRSLVTNTGPKEVIGGPRTQEAAQTNPKSRTVQQILDGVPEGQFEFSAVAEEKQLLAGPLMIPEKLIPRMNSEGEKYYVFFDSEGIQKLAYKMIKNKYLDSVNIEHDPDRKVSDISLVETWLVEDSKRDKSNTYGYELPKGSWFGIYKVNNKQVWDDYIKTGRVKGFSVEGIFADKIIADYGKQG